MNDPAVEWRLVTIRVNAHDDVIIAEWEITFSVIDDPTVFTKHIGIIPITAGTFSADDDPDDILDFIISIMSPSLPEFTYHAKMQLQQQLYEKEAKRTIDLRDDEEQRASLPQLSPRQLLTAALSINLTEADILYYINEIPDEAVKQQALIDWHKATYFQRNHWLVEALRVDMEFSIQEFDALWRWAATIE